MDDTSMAALQGLISELLGGGTQAQVNDRAARNQEIATVRGNRADYSKSSAFADAQGAMAQQMRNVLEKTLPSITRASEAAGTSQNSLRALMIQDAQNRAAESASAQGLAAAGTYGNISANLSSVLERLTQSNDPVASALIQALNVAKGATTQTSGTEQTSSSGSTSSNTSTNQSGTSTVTPNNSNTMTSNSSDFADFNSVVTDPTDFNSLAWGDLMKSTGSTSGAQLYEALNPNSWSARTTF
jgi:hypothetical protein